MLVLFTGLMFFSCSSPLNVAVKENSGLSIIVTNFNHSLDGSRAISPGTFNIANVKKFKIEGEDLDGEPLPLQFIDIDSNGTGQLGALKDSVWSFTLHAYSDEAATNEVLCGYSSVDSRYITVVSFVLSSEGIEKNGTFNFGLKYVPSSKDTVSFTDSVEQFSIAFCNPHTQEPVAGYPKSFSSKSTISEWTSDTGYVFNGTLPAGYYYLLVKFMGIDPDDNTIKEIGLYSDFVDIQPGRETTVSEPIEISGILYQKPACPENLKVYRVEDSLNPEYYTAVLTWEDKSVNEESFVINVYKYDTDQSSTASLLPVTINTSNYQSISLARGDVGYAGGSILYGSTDYAVKLKTGVLYDFEISAVNSIGASDFIKRASSSDVTTLPPASEPLYTIFNKYGTLKGFSVSNSTPYQRVNTFCISYDLRGGIYRGPLNTVKTNYKKVDYHVYSGSPVTLFEPFEINDTAKASGDPNDLNVTDSFPIIYYGAPNRWWTSWVDSNGITVTTTPSASIDIHNAYKNYNVYAVYSSNVIDSVSELDSEGVKITYSSSDYPLPGDGSVIANDASLDVSDVKYITFALDITDAPNSKFEKFDFYVNGIKQVGDVLPSSAVTAGGKKYVLFQFQPFLKGSYFMQVSGFYSGVYFFSHEISFTLG